MGQEGYSTGICYPQCSLWVQYCLSVAYCASMYSWLAAKETRRQGESSNIHETIWNCMEGNTKRELQLTCAKALRVQQSDTKIDFGIDAYCDDNKRRQVSQVTGAKVTWWKDIYLGSPVKVTSITSIAFILLPQSNSLLLFIDKWQQLNASNLIKALKQ